MKLINKSLVLLTAATLIFAAGCKKNNATPEADIAALTQNLDAKWDKADVNALLQFVPEDTALIISSTRQHDIDSPAIKELLKKTLVSFDKSIANSEKKLEGMSEEQKKVVTNTLNASKLFRPLIADYAGNALEWGLHPKGHMDSVIYLSDKTPVMKMMVVDTAKFQAKAVESFKSLILVLADAAKEPMPEAKELKVGNSTWKTYDLSSYLTPNDSKESPFPTLMAVNYDNNIMTLALVHADGTQVLENLLKPAAKPLSKDKLGKISEDTEAVGYIDNIKLFSVLTNAIRTIEGADVFTSACEKEIAALIGQVPTIKFSNDMDSKGVLKSSGTIVLSDKNELKALQDLNIPHIKLGTDQSLATAALNLNVDKGIAWLTSLVDKVSAQKYECEMLNELIPSDLKSEIASLSSPQFKMFTSAINGINLVLDKLNKNETGNFDIEAAVNVTGPTLGASYALLSSLAGASAPELAQLLALKPNEVAEKDLSELVSMPLKVNALLTDKDLVLGTATYDVKAISASEHKNDGTMFSFGFTPSLIGMLDPSLADASETANFYEMHIGTDDEGIKIRGLIY